MIGVRRDQQLPVWHSYDADYLGDTSKFSQGMRAQHGVRDDENWDETIFNVFRKKNGADDGTSGAQRWSLYPLPLRNSAIAPAILSTRSGASSI